jgi:hypothetical protein
MKPRGKAPGTCIYPPQNLAGYLPARSTAKSAEAYPYSPKNFRLFSAKADKKGQVRKLTYPL